VRQLDAWCPFQRGGYFSDVGLRMSNFAVATLDMLDSRRKQSSEIVDGDSLARADIKNLVVNSTGRDSEAGARNIMNMNKVTSLFTVAGDEQW